MTRAVVLEDSAAGQAAGRAAGFEVLPIRHPNDVPGVLTAAGILGTDGQFAQTLT